MEQKVFEEDIETAVALATTVLGPQGRLLHGEKSILYNAKIYTKQHGVIWYGDLTMAELDKVTTLAEGLGVGVDIQTGTTVQLDPLY